MVGSLIVSREGLGTPERQACDSRTGTLSPTLRPPGRTEGPAVEFNHQWTMI